jgi:hypothetical protein
VFQTFEITGKKKMQKWSVRLEQKETDLKILER